MKHQPRKAVWRFWIGTAISVGLVAALMWHLDLHLTLRYIAGADPWMLALALLLCLGAGVYGGMRWWVVVRLIDVDVPLAAAVRLHFVSSFFGVFLPGMVGIEAIRIAGMARLTSNLASSFSSVLVDRLLGVASLVMLVLIGFAVAPHAFDPALRNAAWVMLGLVMLTGFAMLNHRMKWYTLRLIPPMFARHLRPPLERLYASLDVYRGRPQRLAGSAVLAVGAQLLRVAIIGCYALALGATFSPLYLLIIAPIIVFAELLPISLAGLGVTQASYVYLFSLIGIDGEAAFAMSMLHLFVGTLGMTPGAWFAVMGRMSRSTTPTKPPQPAGTGV